MIAVKSHNEQPNSFTCVVEYTGSEQLPGPNIKWTHVNDGEETDFQERHPNFHIWSTVVPIGEGRFSMSGTLTIFNTTTSVLAANDIAVVRCKVGFHGTTPATSDAYLIKLIGK